MIGGIGYKWQGINTRVIGDNIITLPRKNSSISDILSLDPKKNYTLTIRACNKGGDGKTTIDLDGLHNESIYIRHKSFTDYQITFDTSGFQKTKLVTIVVGRASDSSGNILIDSITCSGTPIVEPVIEEVDDTESQEKLQRQLEIGRAQTAKGKEEREKNTRAALIARGEMMGTLVKIGGSNYKWHGTNIKTLYKFGSTCGVLFKPKSILLIPVNVEPKARYKIVVEAAADKVPNKIIVNFFGGLSSDGQNAAIDIVNAQAKKYEIYLNTPAFPPNLQIYFRTFLSKDFGGGNIYIKNIEYIQVANTESKPLPKVKPKPLARARPVIKEAQDKQELEVMKFKPQIKLDYKKEIENVYIQRPEQVPKVSIITPTREGYELIKECYEALNTNTAYPNWEWVVGDSDSKDKTVEYLKSLNDNRIKIVERKTTEGSFSSINNELVKYSDGQYLVFLNNDTAPQKYWLYEMMSKVMHNPTIGVVGARLMYNADKIQHAGIMFIPQGPANVGKDLLKIMAKNFEMEDRFYQAVTGACMLMSRKDFDAVGGFDPIYHFCYEDVDLCLKIREQLNKKVLYAANSVVYHKESVTQGKYGTGGERQREGIQAFKNRWMRKVTIDVNVYSKDSKYNVYPTQISFVTCINNLQQYNSFIVGSLFKNITNKNYEIVPIFNFGNPYSAAQALNMGIYRARGNIVVLCHQDVMFFDNWIEMLFERIREIEKNDKRWGLLGTAGIDTHDATTGVVYNIGGSLEWRSNVSNTFYPVQTLDEHCMVVRKNSSLSFDEKLFTGFHFYGADICLSATTKNMKNYGILCPLVHNSGSSGSLITGRDDFMKFLHALAKKWRGRFKYIRTPTSMVNGQTVKTFIKFRRV